MRGKKLPLLAPFIVLLGVLAWSSAANAFTYMSASGNSCQPQSTDPVGYGEPGAANTSGSTSAIMFCPLFTASQTAARTLSAVVLKFKDGSSTTNFSCTVFQTFPWGSVYESSPKYTCTTAGGCPDPTQSYTGFNYVQWTYSELGANIGVENLDTNFGFFCSVPPGNTSWIISYYSYY